LYLAKEIFLQKNMKNSLCGVLSTSWFSCLIIGSLLKSNENFE
jgi:hypothetical protein